jgi:hypothetical protein
MHDDFIPRRCVCPVTWAGHVTPEAPGVFVCGACGDPAACAAADTCARARPDDYLKSPLGRADERAT